MGYKKEIQRLETTLELALTHANFVTMMNDSSVPAGDSVDTSQEFQLFLKRSNGSEVVLKEMGTSDTLVVRFTKITVTTDEDTINTVDIG